MLALLAGAALGATPLPAESFFDAYARARHSGDGASVGALFREDAEVRRPEAPPLARRESVSAESARQAAAGWSGRPRP